MRPSQGRDEGSNPSEVIPPARRGSNMSRMRFPLKRNDCPTRDEYTGRIIREDYEGSIPSGPKNGLREAY